MSLEFIDGFDHYTSIANLRLKWDPTSNPGGGGFVSGRFGGQAVQVASASNGILTASSALTAVATRTMGMAVYFAGSIPGSTYVIAAFLDGASTQVDFRINSGGTLSVTRNGTVLGTSSSTVTGNTWYYVEFQATIHSSAGAYRLDVTVSGTTTTWLSATGVNTQATANATTNFVQILGTAGIWMYADDLYILNSSGSAPHNTFLGECRVFTSLPNAETAATSTNQQWTPDSGTAHYSRVNESNPDGDSSYVSSSTTDQIDTYRYPTISPGGAIYAVQETITARKDDSPSRGIVAEYRSSGGTNYAGSTAMPLTTSYAMYRHIWETDPATSAAWTAANINAGEYGVKCTA